MTARKLSEFEVFGRSALRQTEEDEINELIKTEISVERVFLILRRKGFYMKKMNYTFSVPDNKRVRMIVSTDCKNEADDQFALAHHLMTPMFIMKGIVPCHFNMFSRD